MWRRFLLAFGISMPFIYLVTVMIAGLLHPGYDWVHGQPSELGRGATVSAKIYNPGMVMTAVAGVLAAIGLISSPDRFGSSWPVAVLTGMSLLLASIGLAFAGLFPLPNPLHHGFGLTAAGVLTPLFGALVPWARTGRFTSLVLLLAFAAAGALMLVNGPPLALAAVMFVSIAFLCRAVGVQPVRGSSLAD